MSQVHGGEPHPHDISKSKGLHTREQVREEQHFNCGTSRVKRGESTKDEWRVSKGCTVQV